MNSPLYTRYFDANNKFWHTNPEYNRTFLQVQQNYANDLLVTRGHLFLNEVYDMLGLPRSKAGAVVGWFKEPNSNLVDFEFKDDTEFSIMLDFNVDGIIYDKLPEF